MLDYQLLKTIHIISSTLLFGTGLGTFFFMLMANRSENVEAVRVTAQTVVIADWIFTTPAGEPLPPRFKRLMRKWAVMGYPAFGTVLVIFALMVYKPWL